MIKRTILIPFDKTVCQKKNKSSFSIEKKCEKNGRQWQQYQFSFWLP